MNLKQSKEWAEGNKGPALCCWISDELGEEAVTVFEEIYQPRNGRAFWGRHTVGGKELPPSKGLAQRATILLLFEQQCLDYKLYKGW
jgi:hypothetical protein